MRLRRPRYADVAATLALVFALSGTAYAVTRLPANSVDTQSIQDGAVTTLKIKNNGVNSSRIQNDSLQGIDVKDGDLTGADVADGSIGNADLGTDSVQAIQIADNTIDGGEIIDNSMTSLDIGSGAIGNSELGSNSVDSAKVVDNSLSLADLVGADVTGAVGSFSLNAQQCGPINISIGGAQVGQSVLISFTTAPPNAIVWGPGRVSAAGTVTTVVCNQSNSSVSSSGQGIRIVTFG